MLFSDARASHPNQFFRFSPALAPASCTFLFSVLLLSTLRIRHVARLPPKKKAYSHKTVQPHTPHTRTHTAHHRLRFVCYFIDKTSRPSLNFDDIYYAYAPWSRGWQTARRHRKSPGKLKAPGKSFANHFRRSFSRPQNGGIGRTGWRMSSERECWRPTFAFAENNNFSNFWYSI